MKVRKVYIKLLALLPIPFLLASCCKQDDCNINGSHIHKYVGSNKKGTITNFFNSDKKYIFVDYIDNYDGMCKSFAYKRDSDYFGITDDDKAFYEAKGTKLFNGKDNWDFLYNIMASKHDFLEYQYQADDGVGGIFRNWSQNKYTNITGKVRVCHYQFCGHKLTYKNGKWIDERSPFVDDVREIIDEYPYFELDCYTVVTKEYELSRDSAKNVALFDLDDYEQPDLDDKELYSIVK